MIDMGQADKTMRRVSRKGGADGQTRRNHYILRTEKPIGANFAMMRQYVGGPLHGHREVVIRGLTMQECQDTIAFPAGQQVDNFGQKYVYTHVLLVCL